MVHELFQQPSSPLWLYVFAVIVLLVLAYIGASLARKYDANGNMRARGGLSALLIAIILGIVIYFLIAANQMMWVWFLALMPVAVILFGIYFAVFAAFGRIMFLIASFVAFFVMIWLIYYSIVSNDWALLAFPIIYFVMIILGGFGWGMWNKRSEKAETSDLLSEVGLSSGGSQ